MVSPATVRPRMPATEQAAGSIAWIGLGSNLDDPESRVRSALAALARIPQTNLLSASRLFRTAPWGVTEQPPFVNAAAQLATQLAPRALLDALLAIEAGQGRQRGSERWGPRTLDLDLLAFGDLQLVESGLTLPHPRIAERAFVLVPLADIDPQLVIPGMGLVAELLAGIDRTTCVAI